MELHLARLRRVPYPAIHYNVWISESVEIRLDIFGFLSDNSPLSSTVYALIQRF